LQGTGTGLVPTTDRKGPVPQSKGKGPVLVVFLRRRQICVFLFWRNKFKMAKKTIVWFFFFGGVEFSVAKILYMFKFEIARLAKNLRRMPNLFILLSY
jgi:hypothetical protein